MEHELSVVVEAPLAKVFALATDLDRGGEWLPPEVRTVRLTEGPTRVGSRYREIRPVLGRLDSQVYEIVALDPPRFVEARSASPRGVFSFRLTFEAPTPSSTRVTLRGSASGLGCVGILFAPLVRHVLRKNMRVDLEGLKTWIEGRP